ncbi:hypothetical protein D3C72_1566590 [compost metagenome]
MAEPPRCAMADAERARLSAWRALSLLLRTVPVNSIIDEAVSSSALACASVRADRSALPLAIWLDATAIVPVPPRTCPTRVARLVFMSRSACSSWPASSLPSATILLLKSPPATACATRRAYAIGVVIERVTRHAKSTPSSRAAAPRLAISTLAAEIFCLICWPPCTTTSRWSSLRRFTDFCN